MDFSKYTSRMEKANGTCERHGAFETFKMPNIDVIECPLCFLDRSRMESAREAQRDRAEHLFKNSNIPARYAECGFKSFAGNDAIKGEKIRLLNDYIRNFTKDWKPILLTGGAGTGKTHLACALARNLMVKGISVRYETSKTMIAEVKQSYNDRTVSEASQVSKYAESFDLLVIDEADVMGGSNTDLDILFSIVNQRYNNFRPILLISNQKAGDALAKAIGERTYDRMSENVLLIGCTWKSYRQAS